MKTNLVEIIWEIFKQPTEDKIICDYEHLAYEINQQTGGLIMPMALLLAALHRFEKNNPELSNKFTKEVKELAQKCETCPYLNRDGQITRDKEKRREHDDGGAPAQGQLALRSDEELATDFALKWTMVPFTRAIDTLVLTFESRDSYLGRALYKMSEKHPDFVIWRKN